MQNKCKIEASIAEAYILEEVSNFTTTYYSDKLSSVHNPPPSDNDGENEVNLNISFCNRISAGPKRSKPASPIARTEG